MKFASGAILTLKHDRCLCDKDLFPDDECDCGYEEEQRLMKRRRIADDRFLRSYPTTIFPYYEQYMSGEEDGMMWWRLRGGDHPTVEETKNKMIEGIAREKMRLLRMPDEQRDGYKDHRDIGV
jgi:hypothetical protein